MSRSTSSTVCFAWLTNTKRTSTKLGPLPNSQNIPTPKNHLPSFMRTGSGRRPNLLRPPYKPHASGPTLRASSANSPISPTSRSRPSIGQLKIKARCTSSSIQQPFPVLPEVGASSSLVTSVRSTSSLIMTVAYVQLSRNATHHYGPR